MSRDGHLSLYDLEGRLMWSANNRHKASRASILDSGNFVMLGHNNKSEIVWDSFAYPGDTLLPGMKMWKGLSLTCWKNSADPAPGPFSEGMDPSPGKTQFFSLYQKHVPYWSSGEWSGDHFTNMPELSGGSMFNMVNTPTSRAYLTVEKLSPSRIYFMFTVKSKVPNLKIIPPRVVLQKTGELQAIMWMDNSGWSLVGSKPSDQCDIYGVCGTYATCNSNNTQLCSCLEGFRPKDNQAQDLRSSGCIRRNPLQCFINGSGTTDGFLEVKDKSLFRREAVVRYVGEQTWDRCRSACLRNCTCSAFAVDSFGASPVCLMWFQDLLNMRESFDGHSIFIRLAVSDLASSSSKAKDKKPVLSLLIPVGVGVVVLALLFAVIIFLLRRGRLLKACKNDDMPTSLRTFTYKELKIATKNFQQKLGSGAFGSVFKGTLRDNTLVAVKRLESLAHADKQFRAEISTIGSIHHVNLVRLRGFCIEHSQRLLVYEYVSNGSLDSFLFSKSERDDEAHKVLEWKTRFQIALGTARGLVYLHEECRDRIIHCDIKPENILLDEDFCPKVADFGLAKLVGRDFSRVLTTTRGTRGYLAPEWISGLPITCKADVYSFGMTMLEILSGRRNLDLTAERSSRCFFPSWAATELQEGNITGVVDARISSHADIEELRRSLIVGLLCTQEDENTRPSMVEVVLILEGTMEPRASHFQSSPEVLLDEQTKQEGESNRYDNS